MQEIQKQQDTSQRQTQQQIQDLYNNFNKLLQPQAPKRKLTEQQSTSSLKQIYQSSNLQNNKIRNSRISIGEDENDDNDSDSNQTYPNNDSSFFAMNETQTSMQLNDSQEEGDINLDTSLLFHNKT